MTPFSAYFLFRPLPAPLLVHPGGDYFLSTVERNLFFLCDFRFYEVVSVYRACIWKMLCDFGVSGVDTFFL